MNNEVKKILLEKKIDSIFVLFYTISKNIFKIQKIQNKNKSWCTKMFIKTYLLNYEFKFLLDFSYYFI